MSVDLSYVYICQWRYVVVCLRACIYVMHHADKHTHTWIHTYTHVCICMFDYTWYNMNILHGTLGPRTNNPMQCTMWYESHIAQHVQNGIYHDQHINLHATHTHTHTVNGMLYSMQQAKSSCRAHVYNVWSMCCALHAIYSVPNANLHSVLKHLAQHTLQQTQHSFHITCSLSHTAHFIWHKTHGALHNATSKQTRKQIRSYSTPWQKVENAMRACPTSYMKERWNHTSLHESSMWSTACAVKQRLYITWWRHKPIHSTTTACKDVQYNPDTMYMVYFMRCAMLRLFVHPSLPKVYYAMTRH